MRLRLVFLAALMAGLVGVLSRAESAEATGLLPEYRPEETRVAILPFINMTGEDRGELLQDVEVADHVVASLFLERGFRVVEDSAVVAAFGEAGIPVHDRAERNADNLSRLARALDARLVVTGLLLDKRSTIKRVSFPNILRRGKNEGRAAVRAEVWDEAAKAVVFATQTPAVCDSGGVLGGGPLAPLRERAVRLALTDCLMQFVGRFPAVASSVDVSHRKAYREAMASALVPLETQWEPSKTSVLVLPFHDEIRSEDRTDVTARAPGQAAEQASDEFARCGFRVISQEEAAQAAGAAGIDPATACPLSREQLRELAAGAGADVVVAGSVFLSVPALIDISYGDIVKVEVRVFDRLQDRCVLVAAGSAGASGRGGGPSKRSHVDRVPRAGAAAVSNALAELLAAYAPAEGG